MKHFSICCFVFLMSCSTYNIKRSLKNHEDAQALNRPYSVSLQVDSSGGLGSCALNKRDLRNYISRNLKENPNINIVSTNQAQYEIIVGAACGGGKSYSASSWGYLLTLSLIPMRQDENILLSVKVTRKKENDRSPSSIIKRDGLVLDAAHGLYFPTPLFLGDMSGSTNKKIASHLSFDIIQQLNELEK